MKRFNFDKTRPNKKDRSAEGIAVHAETMEEAELKAKALLRSDETLIGFRDNRRCHRRCFYCDSDTQEA